MFSLLIIPLRTFRKAMNKNNLIEFITFSLLQIKRVEDRLYIKQIQNYITQLKKRQLKAITDKFIT